jgi:uncharacterized repeat protein (TIGR02543 family)
MKTSKKSINITKILFLLICYFIISAFLSTPSVVAKYSSNYTSSYNVTAGQWYYDINYDLNGGENNTENPDSYSMLNDTYIYDPYYSGYEFTGWYDNSQLSGDEITYIPKGSIEDINLYAAWEMNYTTDLSFELVGDHYEVSIGSYTGTDIVIPETYMGIPITAIADDAFSYCYDITSISLPSTITEIGEYAFYGCINLEQINLPEGLTIINRDAFAYCYSLTEIRLPSTVTTIRKDAFSYCYSLSEIYVEATTPPKLLNNFNNTSLTAIYVPSESVNLYQKAAGWKKSKNIITAMPEDE